MLFICYAVHIDLEHSELIANYWIKLWYNNNQFYRSLCGRVLLSALILGIIKAKTALLDKD